MELHEFTTADEPNISFDPEFDTIEVTDRDAEPDPETGIRRPFEVDNPRKAAWAMRKLRDAAANIARVDAAAIEEIGRIHAWAAGEMRRDVVFAEYLTALLERWALVERERTGVKTQSTPFGKVSTREASGKWVIDDDEFIAWAKDNAPEFVALRRSVGVGDLREVFSTAEVEEGEIVVDSDGQVIPGITIERGEPSATVKVAP